MRFLAYPNCGSLWRGVELMALSTCVKCGGSSFEISHVSPTGSNFKLMFIQCSSCGGVVGVMDFYNIGQSLHDLAKKLGRPLD
jgi:predicted nucleic-acid-binding Zn-ribbon protein